MKKIKSRIIGQKPINWRTCEWLQQDKLKELPKHSFEKLQNSLVRIHFIDPFKVWKDKSGKIWILDGRTRKMGMLELENMGYQIPEELEADFIDCKNIKEAAQLVLIFNSVYSKITEEGLKDHIEIYDLIASELNEVVEIPGIDASLLNVEEVYDEEKLNEVIEPRKKPVSKKGDLFVLDKKHRLLCGDSTDFNDVKLLMNRKKADIVFTDPPFNLHYGGTGKKFKAKFIAGDGISQNEFYEFLDKFNLNIKLFSKPGIAVYEWIDWRSYPVLYFIMTKHFHVEQCIVWDKTYCRLGAAYRNQHEFLIAGFNEEINDTDELYAEIHEMLIYSRTGKKITKWYGGKSESNIWYLNTIAGQLYEHPTQKPVELARRAIKNSSVKDDLVLDLFLGSGSTLIAANVLHRVCYGMELDPLYIDVILRRYKRLYPSSKIDCLNRKFDFNKLFNKE